MVEGRFVSYDKNKWLDDPQVRAEYEKQKPYWEMQRQLIEARRRAKLTQKEIAQRMGVKPSAVSKFESVERESCNFSTIVEYARAVGLKELVIPLS